MVYNQRDKMVYNQMVYNQSIRETLVTLIHQAQNVLCQKSMWPMSTWLTAYTNNNTPLL